MSSDLLSNRTFLIGGGVVFAIWILAPLILMVVFRLMAASGQKIDLLLGFLLMVSLAGMAFGLAFAAVVYFRKPWLLAVPVVLVVLTSILGHFLPDKGAKHTVFIPPDSPLADPAGQLMKTGGATLEHMLLFAIPGMSRQSAEAVAQFTESRQRELAGHITNDRGLANQALRAAGLLTNAAPEVVAAVQKEAESLTRRLTRFNELNVASDCTYVAPDLRDRFLAWKDAWSNVHRHAALDGRAPFQAILQFAAVRSDGCPAIQELHRAAQTALESLDRRPGNGP